MLTDIICMGCSGISAGLKKVCKVNTELESSAAASVTDVLDLNIGERGEVCGVSNLTPALKFGEEGLDVYRSTGKRFGHGWQRCVVNAGCRLPFWGSGLENNLLVISRLRRGNGSQRGNGLVNDHGTIKFFGGRVPGTVSVTPELLMKRAGEVTGKMSLAWEAS